MSGFLLDTNIVSELIKPKPESTVVKWIDTTNEALLFLSVLTIGEIRKGIASHPAVIDGLLAATAHHHNLAFVTRNTGDLVGTGISLFNPWLD